MAMLLIVTKAIMVKSTMILIEIGMKLKSILMIM